MLKAALAFIPVLSGYIFCTTWNETRYLLEREDSQKVYFRAAFWGVWLLLLSLAFITYFKYHLAGYFVWLTEWYGSFPKDKDDPVTEFNAGYWLVVTGLVLVLGTIGGFFLNWVVVLTHPKELILVFAKYLRKKDHSIKSILSLINDLQSHTKKATLSRAILWLNDDFELLLQRALSKSMPICITLKHEKVYVGYVAGTIDPGDKREMLRILPYMSGYRRPEDKRVKFTTFYDQIYTKLSSEKSLKHLEIENFEVAFPYSEILSLNIFDLNAYLAFQSHPPASAAQPQVKTKNKSPFIDLILDKFR